MTITLRIANFIFFFFPLFFLVSHLIVRNIILYIFYNNYKNQYQQKETKLQIFFLLYTKTLKPIFSRYDKGISLIFYIIEENAAKNNLNKIKKMSFF